MRQRDTRERRTGPPLVLSDPDVRATFLNNVSKGVSVRQAAWATGLSSATLYRTLQRGENVHTALEEAEATGAPAPDMDDDDALCLDLYLEFHHTRALIATKYMGLLGQAAEGGQLIRRRTLPNGVIEEEYAGIDWRAVAKLLQYAMPAEYSESQQIALTGADGGPIRVETSPNAKALAATVRRRLDERRAELEQPVVEG